MSMPLELTRLLTLQSPVRQPDGSGGYHESWAVLGHHWARVETRSGNTISGETTPVTRVDYKITVRASRHGTTKRPRAGQRFLDGERSYDINAVMEADSFGRYLICTATEEVSL